MIYRKGDERFGDEWNEKEAEFLLDSRIVKF
jgi:hypothetical protein